MTTEQLAEKRKLYRMIWALPSDRLKVAENFIRHLQEEDDEPLSNEELADLEEAYHDIAAGNVSSWEDVKARMASQS